MRKILLTLHTGYVGMDSHEAYLVPDSIPDEELEDWAYEAAVEHASSYGIYPPSDDVEDGDEDSCYSGDHIEGTWRLFEEKDRGKVTYGSNQEIGWNIY